MENFTTSELEQISHGLNEQWEKNMQAMSRCNPGTAAHNLWRSRLEASTSAYAKVQAVLLTRPDRS